MPKRTGLAGGTGTCAFLVGVGRITPEGFRVRQFFMRDYGEEASSLDALTRHLEPFRVLITYNGRSFDQPLLETRYRMNRARPPFERFVHFDLLYGARRLWKLRFDSCRLVDLENRILGVERQGDAPGALIPYLYFEYLRTQEIARLVPVFHHNATDILTLACLTGIVPLAFNDPSNAPIRHGAEMAALARWLREAGELDQARTLFRKAIESKLRDELLFRTLWDLAALERKLECDGAALEIWNDLAGSKNPFQGKAREELAKYFEHTAKDFGQALECDAKAALELEESEHLRRREQKAAVGRLIKRAPPWKKKPEESGNRNQESAARPDFLHPPRSTPDILAAWGCKLHSGSALRKSAFRATSKDPRKTWKIDGPHHAGNEINHVVADPRDPKRVYATVNSGWFGAHLHATADGGKTWKASEKGLELSGVPDQSIKRLWHIEPGHADEPGVVYLGADPGALFRSRDWGETWDQVSSLTLHPTRDKWMPGAGGMCLHSIQCLGQGRLIVAISAAGAFRSFDNGATWEPYNQNVLAVAHPDKFSGGQTMRA